MELSEGGFSDLNIFLYSKPKIQQEEGFCLLWGKGGAGGEEGEGGEFKHERFRWESQHPEWNFSRLSFYPVIPATVSFKSLLQPWPGRGGSKRNVSQPGKSWTLKLHVHFTCDEDNILSKDKLDNQRLSKSRIDWESSR